ncbi:MAG: hypothetical protein HKL90_13945 [Elusimicrobia bacterium]|nr:hypothetical protein [Elusimicrobiota bacterium]
MSYFSTFALIGLAVPAAFAQTAPDGGKIPCMHVDGAAAATLNWREVGGGPQPVVYIGDIRSSAAIKRVLAAAMPDFARAGAGALAVEMLNVSDQPLLDRYGVDPDARRLIGRRLGAARTAPAEDYLKLFDAAHAAGLDLFALNPDPTTEEAGDSDGPGARNARMAATVASLSRRKGGGRVIVFIDVDLARRGAQPSRLRDDGVDSRSYAFAQPGDPAVARLTTAGLDDGDWLLPGGADYDGLIAVPEVLRETPAR